MDIILLKHINKLRESGGYPNALLVFNALIALLQRFLDYHGKVVLLLGVLRFAKVHKHGYEGSLSVGGEQREHLILNGLNSAANLVFKADFRHLVDFILGNLNAYFVKLLLHHFSDFLSAHIHKGRKMGKRNALTAVLVGGDLRDNLSGNIAGGGEAVRTLNHGSGDDGSVLEHILKVHKVAVVHVLGVIVGVVEVNYTLAVRFDNVLRKQNTLAYVAGNLPRHIVALSGVHNGVFIGVLLLCFLVAALDKA